MAWLFPSPRRSRKVLRVHASCQLRVPEPVLAANWTGYKAVILAYETGMVVPGQLPLIGPGRRVPTVPVAPTGVSSLLPGCWRVLRRSA
jgi:hypothetical protein